MLALVEIVAAGLTFTCTPVAVWDGDGPVWCAEGPRIRLAGIAAREIDGSCKPTQPCPPGDGIDARDTLVGLLGGPKGEGIHGHVLVSGPVLTCVSEGSAGGARTAAWCSSTKTGDLNCAMVGTGKAVRWARYWRGHECAQR